MVRIVLAYRLHGGRSYLYINYYHARGLCAALTSAIGGISVFPGGRNELLQIAELLRFLAL